MDMALTLVSIASFFGMVLAWIMVPTSAAEKTETAPLAAPQVATN